jgi:NAD(P)-dependent dehydrogenase (short-subunit alcohol dehydrogenase family)
MGAHMIIVSHILERSKAAHQRIINEFGEQAAHYYVANLSVQDQIHQLADGILRDYDRLDVLVNNVGGWYRNFKQSADGIEMTLAVNHLSYFLLTGRLLPLLEKSTPARIINVSSDAHRQVSGIRFDDLQFQQRYRAFAVYAHSKLANIMITYELDRRLNGSGITVNTLHPGFVKSELYRHFGIATPIVNLAAGVFGKNAEQGAETSIYLASSPDVADISGKYFADRKPQESSTSSYDEAEE